MDFLNNGLLINPHRLYPSTPGWTGHIPFAGWLIEEHRPNIFVELGTHAGVSYSAFCQSVVENHLSTKCYAVDTWKGDEHASLYDENVYIEYSKYHQQHFSAFSQLLRMTFDDALTYFAEGSIDLLHIDGLHTYDAVKHDFEAWLPKMSRRGIILLHDTNVRERNFGVWKLWEELSQQYSGFDFQHSHGLGVLFIGDDIPENICHLQKKGNWFINKLCPRLAESLYLQNNITVLTQTLTDSAQQITNLTQSLVDIEQHIVNLDQVVISKNQYILNLEEHIANLNHDLTNKNQHIANLEKHTANLNHDLTNKNQHIANLEEHTANLNHDLTNKNQHIANLEEHTANLNHDLTIKDQHIANLEQIIANKEQLLVNLEQQSTNLNHTLADKDQHIANLDSVMANKEKQIVNLEQHDANLNLVLADKDQHIANLDQIVANKDLHIVNLEQYAENLNLVLADKDRHIANLEQDIIKFKATIVELDQIISELNNSISWRLTKPIRVINNKIRKIKYAVSMKKTAKT